MNQLYTPLLPKFDLFCEQAALDDVFSTRPGFDSDYTVAGSSTVCPYNFQLILDYDDLEYNLVKNILDDRYAAYYNLAHKVVALCGTST
jgi:hypothetical protein